LPNKSGANVFFSLAFSIMGLFPLLFFLKTVNITSASLKGTVIKENLSNIILILASKQRIS